MDQILNKKDTYFSSELQAKLDAKVAKYETRRASLLELLHLVMEEKGHISLDDEKALASFVGIPPIDVREVMTFYTLYYDKPKAKTRFNVCRTLACHLNGGEEILKYMEEKLGVQEGETSKDGKCSLKAVECLGACEIAPMMQINDHQYEGNLTKEKIDELIKKWKN